MSILVGARDLKNRLGSYLRLVQQGTRVIVTERGRPVAELRSLESADSDAEVRLQSLEAAGILTRPTLKCLPSRTPLEVQAGSLSEAILEDRADRF